MAIDELTDDAQGRLTIADNIRRVLNQYQDYPNLREVVGKNKCLPYVVNNGDGTFCYVVDFTRTVPNTLQEYQMKAQQSFQESFLEGLFSFDYGGKC